MALTKNILLKNPKTKIKMNKYIWILFLTGLIGISVQQVSGQVWEVPADQKKVKNPSPLNNANVKAGKELFMINCKSCHGDPGKNNGLPLVPPPPDVASEKMQANSDAEIFYKMTTGRVAMPSFANTLTPDQRWKIVNFIKSFDPKNAGLLIKEEPIKARLVSTADVSKSTLHIAAEAQNKTGVWGPLQAEVLITARRTFGHIEVGKAKTDELGMAEFVFPKEFIGDKEGAVDLVLSLGDEYSFKAVELNKVKIAHPVEPEDIFARRVLWSTNPRTQIWLILTYLGVVGGVWLTIFYIVFLIFKMYKAGNT
jgi:mono/diheme cytochrome c family protein